VKTYDFPSYISVNQVADVRPAVTFQRKALQFECSAFFYGSHAPSRVTTKERRDNGSLVHGESVCIISK
jgi:hypothetical protein